MRLVCGQANRLCFANSHTWSTWFKSRHRDIWCCANPCQMHPVFIAAQSAKGRSGVAKKCAVSKQHLEQPQHIVPCAASKLSLRQPSRRKATNKRVCSLCGCLSSICTTIPRGAFETRQNDAQIVGLFPIRVGIRNGDARQQRSRIRANGRHICLWEQNWTQSINTSSPVRLVS